MPEVSRFFGIVITMNYRDHARPHFHVRYIGQRALIGIDSLSLLRGELSPRVFGMVMEWAIAHKTELAEDWSLARDQLPLMEIAPLE